MKKFNLNNGLTVVFEEAESEKYSVGIIVNVGHINEPKAGLDTLFKRTMMIQTTDIIAIPGGTVNIYLSNNKDLSVALKNVAKVFDCSLLTQDALQKAKNEIKSEFFETLPLAAKRAKKMYATIAYGSNTQTETKGFIHTIMSYSVNELMCFFAMYYNASNTTLIISGKKLLQEDLKKQVMHIFGNLPQGRTRNIIGGNIFTGGFSLSYGESTDRAVLLGFDINHLNNEDILPFRILVPILLYRIRKGMCYYSAEEEQMVDIKEIVYYGLSTLRISVNTNTSSPKKMLDIICYAITQTCNTPIPESWVDKARQSLISKKTFLDESKLFPALNIAWKLLDRGNLPNNPIDKNKVMEIKAEDIQKTACKIFRHSLPAYMLVKGPGKIYYSYEELLEKLNLTHLL